MSDSVASPACTQSGLSAAFVLARLELIGQLQAVMRYGSSWNV